MDRLKKFFWFGTGLFFLGVAYIGIITPGIPWSTPSLIATYCFARSSQRFHSYMMNHRLFGPFIRDWHGSRVFPTQAKWFMFASMDASLVILYLATNNWRLTMGMSVFFALILIWSSRYPGDKQEADRRRAAGERMGWLK